MNATVATRRRGGLIERARPNAVMAALFRSGGATRGASVIVRLLLKLLRHDRLMVRDDRCGSRLTYGSRLPTISAEAEVNDRRAYLAVLGEGSSGLGRGFIEGWWTSGDPTAVVRVIVRNLAALDRVRNRTHRPLRLLGAPVQRTRRRSWRHDNYDSGRAANRDEIAAHYDIGNEFFSLFLDESMTYSCGIFSGPDTSLRQASINKFDVLLDKLAVTEHHHLGEIGAGWGSMAIHAATTRGCRVTTTTISAEQLAAARGRVSAAGCDDRVEVQDTDWRDFSGRFDRIVSIEMIEAVSWRDYDRYFATIERNLAPDGLVGLQAICVPDARFERAKHTDDFIRRFVFPNGCLPSLGAIHASVARATTLTPVHVADLSEHYATTLRHWRQRFEARVDDAGRLGLDDRFCRMWRFYLAYCEAAFLERHCTVAQIVLAGPAWRGSIPT
jgi:cyclopropane-fatty-acyl-phospholipid synthase